MKNTKKMAAIKRLSNTAATAVSLHFSGNYLFSTEILCNNMLETKHRAFIQNINYFNHQ